MDTNRRIEISQLVVIAGMFSASAILWPTAPDRFPVHWNLAGEVDRFGGKFEGMLLTPIITVALYCLFLFLPRIDPHRQSYTTFSRAYGAIRLAMMCLMALIHTVILLVAFGFKVDIALLAPLGIGILMCVIGNFMGKFRKNWFVGVRTPWTFSSPLSWTRTHRLAGKLFIVLGVALCLLGLMQNTWALSMVIAMVVAVVIGLPVYSYIVWRHDPERQQT